MYGNSIAKALSILYPESFKMTDAFWQNKENHRSILDQYAHRMGISNFEDWYKVDPKDVISRGGMELINYSYGGSLINGKSTSY
jgi:hypothetical protein